MVRQNRVERHASGAFIKARKYNQPFKSKTMSIKINSDVDFPILPPDLYSQVREYMPPDYEFIAVKAGTKHALKNKLAIIVPANAAEKESSLDRLEVIFDKQSYLMRIYSCHPEQIRNWAFGSVQEFMIKICWAMVREIVEACDYLPWRWWNKHKNEWDKIKFRRELVDCMHFLVELAILGGIKPEEFFQDYLEKNKINVQNALEEQKKNAE